MSKERAKEYMGKMFENEMLIRNVDCGVLYFRLRMITQLKNLSV